jgi:hypothetical protein
VATPGTGYHFSVAVDAENSAGGIVLDLEPLSHDRPPSGDEHFAREQNQLRKTECQGIGHHDAHTFVTFCNLAACHELFNGPAPGRPYGRLGPAEGVMNLRPVSHLPQILTAVGDQGRTPGLRKGYGDE